jgi:hypothetical protein
MRIEHVLGVGQSRIVELKDEPGIDDGPVLDAEGLGNAPRARLRPRDNVRSGRDKKISRLPTQIDVTKASGTFAAAVAALRLARSAKSAAVPE